MVKSERDQSETLNAQNIRNCLTDIRSRMYRQELLRIVVLTTFCGLVLLVILFLLNRLILLPMPISSISWIVMCVAVIIGVCLSIKHRKDLLSVAQTVDEKMDLRERLGTAFGLIQNIPQGEFAQFQIRDAAETIAPLDIGKVSPYRVPKLLRLFPVPLLLICLSFAIPTLYEVQQPLTESQQQALDRVIQNLEGQQAKNPILQEKIRDTVNKLKAATYLDTAQEHLSSLNREVRKQKSEQSVIAEETETSRRFRGMDADELASELKNLTDEQMRDIIAALQKAETLTYLEQLEAELIAYRKELALADIETTTSDGGIANADGTPGQNAGTREVQGTRETLSNTETQSTPASSNDGEAQNATDEGNPTAPLTGDETSALQINGEHLTLTTVPSGDSESFSGVFTGEIRTGDPPHLPFSYVVLNAERAHAEAINNNRIPIKYRAQIKDYLEAISTKNEKELN